MIKKKLTCISCPIGCQLEVEMEDKKVAKITGNNCKRGAEYGEKECTNPTRIVTSTVVVVGGLLSVVSVKSEVDIPKQLVFDTIRELKKVSLKAPVKIGQIVIENIFNTGVNIIATASVKRGS
ncbi:MAG: DUF1667 domain-containing protein [Clostridiaceae bacterium]|nr:DUF1667 domain-containing protein [Clostridiaceae bacterium]